MTKALILLSGGLDCTTCLAMIKDKYSLILALTFDYAQKSLEREINASKEISNYYKIQHKIIKLDWLGEISQSALNTKSSIPLLNESDLDNAVQTQNTANSVWVPNRNVLFINIAACFAEAKGFDDIIIGANKEEGESFIDNSKEFITAINNSLKYSVNSKINVIAPLINMTKNDIVKKAVEHNIPFNLIYSCYNGNRKHCGKSESCQRLKRALKNCLKIDIIKNIFEV